MNTKIIFIVGGDGFARECYVMFKEMMHHDNTLVFGGFLGHAGYGSSVDYKDCQHLYKGEVSEHTFCNNEYAVIGAAYPNIRKNIYTELKHRHVKLYTLHLAYQIPENTSIGEGNIFIFPFYCSCNVNIGNANVFNYDINIGHDVQVGDCNFFAPRTMILGNARVGNENSFGASSIVLPKAKLGNGNKIAPLTVVYKGCRNNCYLAGNPAQKIGIIDEV